MLLVLKNNYIILIFSFLKICNHFSSIVLIKYPFRVVVDFQNV